MRLFQYTVIKLHLSDTVVFDYPHIPTVKLLERHIIVAVLSQNTDFLFWLCFVSLERTRPNDGAVYAGANCMLMV